MDAFIIGLIAVLFFIAGYMVKGFIEKDHTSTNIGGGGSLGPNKPEQPDHK